jgi:hypothetical protein
MDSNIKSVILDHQRSSHSKVSKSDLINLTYLIFNIKFDQIQLMPNA